MKYVTSNVFNQSYLFFETAKIRFMHSEVRLIAHTYTEFGWPNPSQHSRSSFLYLPPIGKELVSVLRAKHNRDDIRVSSADNVSFHTYMYGTFHIDGYVH